MSNDPVKPTAADPEIPDELRSTLTRPHRPAGYVPKSDDPDIDAENPEPEPVKGAPPRNLKKFWKALAASLKEGVFIEMPEEYEVRVPQKGGGFEVKTKERMVKQKVLEVGANGLPFLVVPVAAPEVARIKARNYPDAPSMDPMLGDLTPDFVEWLYLNHPYDATVRYYARQTHVQVAALDNHTS